MYHGNEFCETTNPQDAVINRSTPALPVMVWNQSYGAWVPSQRVGCQSRDNPITSLAELVKSTGQRPAPLRQQDDEFQSRCCVSTALDNSANSFSVSRPPMSHANTESAQEDWARSSGDRVTVIVHDSFEGPAHTEKTAISGCDIRVKPTRCSSDPERPIKCDCDIRRPIRCASDTEKPIRCASDTERPIRGGFNPERSIRGGFDTERPIRGDFDAEKPFRCGSDGEKRIRCGSDTERPIRCGSDAERPIRCGTDPERPIRGGFDTEKPIRCGYDPERPISCSSDPEKPIGGGSDTERPIRASSSGGHAKSARAPKGKRPRRSKQQHRPAKKPSVQPIPNNPWGDCSYTDLLTMAILSSEEKRLTLSEIYDWISQNVPYFEDKRNESPFSGWKNSVRHVLSSKKRFMRLKRSINGEGPSFRGWWCIDPNSCIIKSSQEPERLCACQTGEDC